VWILKKTCIAISLSLVFLLSCVKDKPTRYMPANIQLSASQKVYIINEGNFMNANASVSLFDTGTGDVVEDYYSTINNHKLGDVAQSMTKINNNYFIVVNNSGKVAVCNPLFNLKFNITGLQSPRQVHQVNNQKAYVSDLYANAISIINVHTGQITGSITCGGWTEKMAQFYDKVYVTNKNKEHLYVIDAKTDVITDSIFLGYSCGDIVKDKNDQLWLLGTNNSNPAMEVYLTRIDPANWNDKHTVSYSNNYFASSLSINGGGDTLYFINGGIRYQPISSLLVPKVLVEPSLKNFYGMAVNPLKNEVYVSDALDYVQKSNIYVYHSVSGNLLRQFKAGINAGAIYFD